MLAISQMELAERAGISSGYVGEVEMGRKYPSPEILIRIADALEVKPYRLLMSDADLAEMAGKDAMNEAASRLTEKFGEKLGDMVKDFYKEERREGRPGGERSEQSSERRGK